MLKNWILAGLVIISLILFPATSYAVVEISDGSLEAYYHLDEDSVDSSGNGYNGSDTGMTYTSTAGILDGAGLFSNTYPNNDSSITADLSAGGLTDITINFWLKASSTSSGDWGAISFGHWSTAGNLSVDSNNDGSTDNKIGSGGYADSPDTQSNFAYWSKTTVLDDSWHMITIVRDSANVISQIWVDGVNDRNHAMTTVQAITSESEFYIGTFKVGSNYRGWNGYIDEVAIFNSPIGTSTIEALYNSGLGDTICTETGCGTPSSTATSTQLIHSYENFKWGFYAIIIIICGLGWFIYKTE